MPVFWKICRSRRDHRDDDDDDIDDDHNIRNDIRYTNSLEER